MSVKKDVPGYRRVEMEIELPGSPEDVWEAIATGPGISSWFVPTEVEGRQGGAVAFHMGAGMDSVGSVTAWEPPRRFAYEERGWAPDAPPLATEITIEARAGGTCTVRLVHSLFAATDDWDNQLESMESGWPWFFEILRLVLGEFRGRPSFMIQASGASDGSEAEISKGMVRALGLTHPATGERARIPGPQGPPLDGIVQRASVSRPCAMFVKLERPAAGGALFFVHTWGGRVVMEVALYLFGADASRVAARDEPLWRAWVEQLLEEKRVV